MRAQDPLAIIGILGIFFPFILLGIAIATGYVDVSNYRQAVVIVPLGQRFVMTTRVMAICSACGDAADLQPAGCRAAATKRMPCRPCTRQSIASIFGGAGTVGTDAKIGAVCSAKFHEVTAHMPA